MTTNAAKVTQIHAYSVQCGSMPSRNLPSEYRNQSREIILNSIENDQAWNTQWPTNNLDYYDLDLDFYDKYKNHPRILEGRYTKSYSLVYNFRVTLEDLPMYEESIRRISEEQIFLGFPPPMVYVCDDGQ